MRRLLTRHNTTPLIHLEIGLLESTSSVVGSSVHDLSARSDFLDVHLLTTRENIPYRRVLRKGNISRGGSGLSLKSSSSIRPQ